MSKSYTVAGSILIMLILVVVAAYAYLHTRAPQSTGVISTASYLCREGKTIDAQYKENSVTLTLSDTRAFVLPQVMSGSGIRYEQDGVVFIGKGDNAFLEEQGTQTYVDCVANGSSATAGSDGARQFADSARSFMFMYPSTVTVSGGDGSYTQSWMNNATSSGMILAKAVLERAYQPNTNFSEATLTVGTSADPSSVASCLSYNPSGGPPTPSSQKTINGTTYTVLTSSDAGAGNRYETESYRTVRGGQCYVIEYTVHSTALGNYSPDQNISAYDVSAVASVMESIITSFQFTDGA